MESGDSVTGPINIGNPVEFTILELAETILKLSNSKSILEFELLPSDDPKQRQPDIKLATELLKWQPKVQLEEGILKTLPYFRDLLKL
jgi:UDP-glucuronate decarboxylase